MPAAQMESKRLYSAAGLLFGEKKSNLDPEKAEKILFMYDFLKY